MLGKGLLLRPATKSGTCKTAINSKSVSLCNVNIGADHSKFQ